MKLPKYWIKGSVEPDSNDKNIAADMGLRKISCWGWSDISIEDARARAVERARATLDALLNGRFPGRYLYGERPLREMIIQEWKREDGSTYAAVTRNSYGCEVLNTANAMFVDVDCKPESQWDKLTRGIKGLFGKKTGPSPREQQEAAALEKVHAMVEMDPQCGVRVYRTHSGLRYLLTHSTADPVAETTLKAMEVLGADPLYMRLCKTQECFRARLTPKPWRCGFYALRIKYPWKDQKAEMKVDRWITDYSKKTKSYASCRFLDQFGASQVHPEIAYIIQYHDEATMAHSDLALA